MLGLSTLVGPLLFAVLYGAGALLVRRWHYHKRIERRLTASHL
jgi:hypothetical protein